MKKNNTNIQPLIILVILVVIGYFLLRWRSQQLHFKPIPPAEPVVLPTTTPECTPTFADGDGPYYQPDAPFRQILSPNNNKGEQLIVSGKVFASDCVTPLGSVVLDIWQANENGNYDTEWYRGRIRTNEDGSYTFTTVVPKGYGEGTAFRPPHIHFKVWEDDKLLITSEMFMPASRAQGINEAYIVKLRSIERDGKTMHTAIHDIIVP